jgi:hypothetical protein
VGEKYGPMAKEPPRRSVSVARKLCRRLIEQVEEVLVGRTDGDWEWHADHRKTAIDFVAVLAAIRVPLDDRLTYFREYVVPSYSSDVEAWGDLGLPVCIDASAPDEPPSLHLGLARAWLRHMRDFGDTLVGAWKRSRYGYREGCSRGGRKKSKAVEAMEAMVQEVFDDERKHLSHNGVSGSRLLDSLQKLTAAEWLRRINDKQPRRGPFPLHGSQSRKYQRQVTRSPAWRALHECTEAPDESEEPEALAREKHTESFAAANGLSVRCRTSHLQRQNCL